MHHRITPGFVIDQLERNGNKRLRRCGHQLAIIIGELAERVIALTGSKSRLIKLPLPQDDPTRRCPDITLAKRQLNWEPRVPLEDGLKETIAYLRTVI